MGKGVVYPFSSNSLFVISRRKEKEAVDKMIAHFVTAPSLLGQKHQLTTPPKPDSYLLGVNSIIS